MPNRDARSVLLKVKIVAREFTTLTVPAGVLQQMLEYAIKIVAAKTEQSRRFRITDGKITNEEALLQALEVFTTAHSAPIILEDAHRALPTLNELISLKNLCIILWTK
jgi:hypothetical protein